MKQSSSEPYEPRDNKIHDKTVTEDKTYNTQAHTPGQRDSNLDYLPKQQLC